MGFSGYCDEFEFYNKALTQSDILTAYLNPRGVAGLQAWYNFNLIDGGSAGSFLNKVTTGDKKDIKATFYKFTGRATSGGLESGRVVEFAPTLASGRTVIPADSEFTLSAPAVEHGNLTFKVDGAVVSAGSKVKINKSVEVTAAPASGYKLVEIYVNGTALVGNTFIMSGDASVTAKFVAENAYQVSYTVQGDGAMTIADSNSAPIENKGYAVAGTQLTITLTPSSGTKLISLKKGTENITSLVTNNQLVVTMPAENVTYTAAFASPYCKPTSNRKSSTERRLATITVSGAKVNGVSAPFTNDLNNNSQPNVYLDKTANIINTTKGDELTISWTIHNEIPWMHYYVYIDYDKDEIFNQENELVSYTYYNAVNEEPVPNSVGEIVTAGQSFTSAPKFTIPADALVGQTRLRFKVDWNSKDPCGNTASNNLIGNNNGTILDYTIDIKGTATSIDNESTNALVLRYDENKLFIDGMKEGDKLAIYNLAGNKVKEAEIAETDVQDLVNGCYLIKVTTASGFKTMKFIKR
ncbi:MAG: GEVED domain-containing protein, partial [Bacteroides sp.]